MKFKKWSDMPASTKVGGAMIRRLLLNGGGVTQIGCFSSFPLANLEFSGQVMATTDPGAKFPHVNCVTHDLCDTNKRVKMEMSDKFVDKNKKYLRTKH